MWDVTVWPEPFKCQVRRLSPRADFAFLTGELSRWQTAVWCRGAGTNIAEIKGEKKKNTPKSEANLKRQTDYSFNQAFQLDKRHQWELIYDTGTFNSMCHVTSASLSNHLFTENLRLHQNPSQLGKTQEDPLHDTELCGLLFSISCLIFRSRGATLSATTNELSRCRGKICPSCVRRLVT